MRLIRKKSASRMVELNTASMPDIVFMLLFFFLVTAVLRPVDTLLKVEQPATTETEAIENRSLVATILIGTPLNEGYGTVERIQIDNRLVHLNEVGHLILQKMNDLSSYQRSKFRTIIKADKDARMMLVTKVKEELRKVDALNIQYSTLEEKDVVEL